MCWQLVTITITRLWKTLKRWDSWLRGILLERLKNKTSTLTTRPTAGKEILITPQIIMVNYNVFIMVIYNVFIIWLQSSQLLFSRRVPTIRLWWNVWDQRRQEHAQNFHLSSHFILQGIDRRIKTHWRHIAYQMQMMTILCYRADQRNIAFVWSPSPSLWLLWVLLGFPSSLFPQLQSRTLLMKLVLKPI